MSWGRGAGGGGKRGECGGGGAASARARAGSGEAGLDERFHQTDGVREVLSRGGAVDGGGEARDAVAGGRLDSGSGHGRGGGEAVAAAAVALVRSNSAAAE